MARILVVDDEPSIRETLGVFLEEEGHEVASVATVAEAVSLLERSGFDVIVSDIVLPRESGMELLRLVTEKGLQAKVVLITGEPNYSSAAECLRLGAFDYLAKPVTQQAICRVVASAAARRRAEEDGER